MSQSGIPAAAAIDAKAMPLKAMVEKTNHNGTISEKLSNNRPGKMAVGLKAQK